MKIHLEIPRNFYNALRVVSAKNDVRPYLNGILLDFKKRRWVATDGHRALIIPMNTEVCAWQLAAKDMPESLIITTTRQKISGDKCEIYLEKHNEKWTIVVCNMRNANLLWQEIVKLVEGKFPDIDRVTPKWPKHDPESIPFAAYNPQYVADVAKELENVKAARVMPIGDEASNSALVEFSGISRSELTYIVMPIRWPR